MLVCTAVNLKKSGVVKRCTVLYVMFFILHNIPLSMITAGLIYQFVLFLWVSAPMLQHQQTTGEKKEKKKPQTWQKTSNNNNMLLQTLKDPTNQSPFSCSPLITDTNKGPWALRLQSSSGADVTRFRPDFTQSTVTNAVSQIPVHSYTANKMSY